MALRRGHYNVARLKFDLERWAFESNMGQVKKFDHRGSETRLEYGVAEDSRDGASVFGDGSRGESNLVQVKNFHGARAETRRRCGEGDDSGGWMSDVRVAGKGESNLVQAKIFFEVVGSRVCATAPPPRLWNIRDRRDCCLILSVRGKAHWDEARTRSRDCAPRQFPRNGPPGTIGGAPGTRARRPPDDGGFHAYAPGFVECCEIVVARPGLLGIFRAPFARTGQEKFKPNADN